MRQVIKDGFIKEGEKYLDYGCGRGQCADRLDNFEKYDPHYFPKNPLGRYDLITCHYVLNVVDIDSENEIIENITRLLAPGGTALITVRRDKYNEGISSRGTY
jgi:ubiquinone/menaquinone biosynthesis C-methylase UbiE